MSFLAEMIDEHPYLGACFIVAIIVGVPTLLFKLIAMSPLLKNLITMIVFGGFTFLLIIAPIMFIIIVIKEKIARGKKV